MYTEGIILECIKQIKDNRTIYGIYHILAGKKSIQSVHDARLFRLEKYYGIYQTMTRESFISIITTMQKNNLIKMDKDYYQITDTGEAVLKEYRASNLVTYLNGIRFTGRDITFIERLYLLVQTYSNIKANNNAFIPIIDRPEITSWVRTFYQQKRHIDITETLYKELYQLLTYVSDLEAEFFINRFTGYKYIGRSMDQLANEYQLTRDNASILLIGIIHRLLHVIGDESSTFEILTDVASVTTNNQKFITNTANQTYQLLRDGYHIQQIADKRNLKLNTIYDHIVEIALYDRDMEIESFVKEEDQSEILAAIQKARSYKLKAIKDHCHDSISYFQIRLVLARLKELLPGDDMHD
ncbi:helix-turn-helix domain-containing protein [Ornithinibacillus scapharcae]|uniref:helix-turn-helix domain-containing protein n=1 Tax=Ornithinibacillus scapharcae TaxID=1147159 RepID=UPI000225BBA9|nr:helix-turn-helix domain-containing protein [Ornithinibacillus scapharcae]